MKKKRKKKPVKKFSHEKSKKRKKVLQKKPVKSARRKSKTNSDKKNKSRKRKPSLVSEIFADLKRLSKPGRKGANRSKKTVKKQRTVRKNKILNTSRKDSIDYRGNKFEYLHIDLSQYKTFVAKINAIRNWSGNGITYFLNKEEKLPKAFMVILLTLKEGEGNSVYDRANKLSPPEMHVDIPNIKKLILEYMIAFQDNFIEYVQDDEGESDWVYDPSNIIGVDIRFFY